MLWIIVPALLIFFAYAGLFAYVCYAETHVSDPAGANAIVILGAQVKADGSPSVQLEYRLKTALDQYLKSPMPIVSCGGQGENEPAPEGEVMTNWLLQNGVAPEHAIAETESESTEQNIKNALALLPGDIGRILIVTSDYHLPRALAIARDQGADACGVGAETLPEYWLKNRAREALAWGKYLIKRALP